MHPLSTSWDLIFSWISEKLKTQSWGHYLVFRFIKNRFRNGIKVSLRMQNDHFNVPSIHNCKTHVIKWIMSLACRDISVSVTFTENLLLCVQAWFTRRQCQYLSLGSFAPPPPFHGCPWCVSNYSISLSPAACLILFSSYILPNICLSGTWSGAREREAKSTTWIWGY